MPYLSLPREGRIGLRRDGNRKAKPRRCARYAREFSETPKASAFWRVAPTVLLSALAIFGAGVLLRAIVFNSFTSLLVHSRRFAFLAMVPLSIRFKELYA
jgi:hypothetical protein